MCVCFYWSFSVRQLPGRVYTLAVDSAPLDKTHNPCPFSSFMLAHSFLWLVSVYNTPSANTDSLFYSLLRSIVAFLWRFPGVDCCWRHETRTWKGSALTSSACRTRFPCAWSVGCFEKNNSTLDDPPKKRKWSEWYFIHSSTLSWKGF